MVRSLLLIAALAVSGCVGPDGSSYIGAPGSPAWFATASPETQASFFRKRCAAYGFPEGSPQMAQCIMSEAGSTRQAASARSTAVSRTVAESQPKHMTCNRFGSTIDCMSY